MKYALGLIIPGSFLIILGLGLLILFFTHGIAVLPSVLCIVFILSGAGWLVTGLKMISEIKERKHEQIQTHP